MISQNKNSIEIRNLLQSNLASTREAAIFILSEIVRQDSHEVQLSFKDIHFASRSFLHEIIRGVSNLKSNLISVAFVECEPEIYKMLEVVSNHDKLRTKSLENNMPSDVIASISEINF